MHTITTAIDDEAFGPLQSLSKASECDEPLGFMQSVHQSALLPCLVDSGNRLLGKE